MTKIVTIKSGQRTTDPTISAFNRNLTTQLQHMNLKSMDVMRKKYNALIYAAIKNAIDETPLMTSRKVARLFGMTFEDFTTRMKRGRFIKVSQYD